MSDRFCLQMVSCGDGGCGTGDKGGFPDMELLFDGIANTVGVENELEKAVTDYKALVVEYGSLHGENWQITYEFIPVTSDIFSNGYSKLLHFYNTSTTCYRWRVYWKFLSDSTFYCYNVAKGEDPVTKENMVGADTAILKIYGIK